MTAKTVKVVLSGEKRPKRIKLDRPDFSYVTEELRRRFNLEPNTSLAAVVIEDDNREEYSITTSADLADNWDVITELHVYEKNQANLTVAIESKVYQGCKNVEVYKVDAVPEPGSLVVQDAYRQIGIHDALTDVNRNFKRIAVIANVSYFAAVASGNAEMQAGTKELGFHAINICDAVDTMMQSCIQSSCKVNQTVLTDIEHLKENDYNGALNWISALEVTAQNWVETTDALISTIDEVSKSGMLSKDTSLKILQEGEKVESYEKEQRKKESKLRQLVHDESKISAAGASLNQGIINFVHPYISYPLTVANKYLAEAVKNPNAYIATSCTVLACGVDVLSKYVADKDKEITRRREAEAEKQQLNMDLDVLKESITDAKNSEKCMHVLYGQLVKMKSDLSAIKKFFKGLMELLKASIRDVTKFSLAHDCKTVDCSKLLESEEFKRKVVIYQAKWVALASICEEGRLAARDASKELHEVVKRNPTKQEAREQVDAMIEAAKDA